MAKRIIPPPPEPMPNHRSDSEKAMDDIRRKDWLYRTAMAVMWLFILIVGIIMIGIELYVIHHQTAVIKKLEESNTLLLQEVHASELRSQRYILCIAEYFAEPPNDNKTIANLENCVIKDDLNPAGAAPGNTVAPFALAPASPGSNTKTGVNEPPYENQINTSQNQQPQNSNQDANGGQGNGAENIGLVCRLSLGLLWC